MASGPEHYREAERLIVRAHDMQSDRGPGCGSEEELAEAQVHATLALAAATAMANAGDMPLSDCEDWHAAASSSPDVFPAT